MKFRRRSRADDVDGSDGPGGPGGPGGEEPAPGPYDVDEIPDDDVERVDLGSLLMPAVEGWELRMQVDEATDAVQSVMLAGEEGALEVRAFAAPRNGDLWAEVRPQIAEDMTQRGGTAVEREGRLGTELVCQISVQTPDGGTGIQPSRIIGVNGPRWLLRATLLGRPAMEFDDEEGGAWERAITQIAVRRGTHALPVGEPLPLELPESARRIEQ